MSGSAVLNTMVWGFGIERSTFTKVTAWMTVEGEGGVVTFPNSKNSGPKLNPICPSTACETRIKSLTPS